MNADYHNGYVYLFTDDRIWKFHLATNIGQSIYCPYGKRTSIKMGSKILFAQHHFPVIVELDLLTDQFVVHYVISNVPYPFRGKFMEMPATSLLRQFTVDYFYPQFYLRYYFHGDPLLNQTLNQQQIPIAKNGLIYGAIGMPAVAFQYDAKFGKLETEECTPGTARSNFLTFHSFDTMFRFYGLKRVQYFQYNLYIPDLAIEHPGPFKLKGHTINELPPANLHKNSMVVLIDTINGAKVIFSDGIAWKNADGTVL